MAVLFADHRPGWVFALTGGDIMFRDFMIHLHRNGVSSELHGAGEAVRTWHLGVRQIERRVEAWDCRIKRVANDRIVYRARESFGDCTLFATADDQLRALERGLRQDRWSSVVTLLIGADRIADVCMRLGKKVFLFLQELDTRFSKSNIEFFARNKLPILSLSKFIQKSIWEEHGCRSKLMYPKIEYAFYTSPRPTSRKYITLATAHPVKGLATFLEIARRLPELRFLAVEGYRNWAPLTDDVRESIRKVPNVRLLPPQPNMRHIYAKTNLLLVPSIWNEGFGRVVLEAQINGIPVLASDRGGLSEAVGSGGVVVSNYKSVPRWVREIRQILNEPKRYDRLAAAAIANARRFSVDRPDPRLLRIVS